MLKFGEPWTWREALGRHHLAVVIVQWLVAERSPHPLERAGRGVEDDDAVIAVAVGDVQLVRRRVHPDVGGAMDVPRIRVAFAAVALADPERDLAVAGELENLIVVERLQPGDAVGGAVVPGDPDKAFRIDVNAVLAFRPVRAGVFVAPRLDERAARVEHDHRRRRRLTGLERARPMQEPHVVLRIDREAGCIAELHVRRQLRPRLVDLELGKVARPGLCVDDVVVIPETPGKDDDDSDEDGS